MLNLLEVYSRSSLEVPTGLHWQKPNNKAVDSSEQQMTALAAMALVWKRIPMHPSFSSTRQFITAFEKCKRFGWGENTFMLFTWLFTVQMEPWDHRTKGSGVWPAAGVGGSHPHSCHRGTGSSHDLWDMRQLRAIAAIRAHSFQVWVSKESFIRKVSSSQRDRRWKG